MTNNNKRPNPWKYTSLPKDVDITKNPYVFPKKKKIEETPKVDTTLTDYSNLIIKSYNPIKAKNYAKRIAELKKQGLVIPSFSNNLEFRIKQANENPNTELNGLSLWDNWLDSNCAACYNGKDKFKIIHNCEELINIPEDFNDLYIQSDYNKYKVDNKNVFELKIKDDKYNKLLTQSELLKHNGWLALVKNDKKLLENYSNLVFKDRKEAMIFWIDIHSQGNLEQVYVNDIGNGSNAVGISDIICDASFLQLVTHK